MADIIPLTETEAREAARLFNAVGRKRVLRVDTMIAATGIVAKAPLATTNHDDFKPFVAHGLELIPWIAREAAIGFAQLEAGQTVEIKSEQHFKKLIRGDG